MDSPNYVLKTNEAVLMPTKNNPALDKLKIAVWVVIAVIVVGSLIFQDNLFMEMNWTTRLLLIAVAIKVLLSSKKEDVPAPMELQFFDDYLIVYRPKKYYSRKVSRKEVNKMIYSEINRCVYRAKTYRLHFYGNVSATWYDYDANGNPSPTPTYDRYVKDTVCFIRTRCAPDVNFKQIIEEHSPIQVTVEDL